MATIADYLTQLQADKQTLVDNLVAKGVEATNEETFTTLVPKINSIETDGGTTPEIGYIVNECNSSGFPTKISVVGLTAIPDYYFSNPYSNVGPFYHVTYYYLLGNIISIGRRVFTSNYNIKGIVIPNTTVIPTIVPENLGTFDSSTITNGTGYIYVPDNLVEDFKAATNWSAYADQIRPISSLNNILDLSQQQFPITTDGNITVDYDAESQTFTLNGTIEESHGFNIPITQELLGTYTLSYNNTETDRGFYISIDNKTETMLNGWGENTKTFTLIEQPSQLMFWFDYSDSTPERNVYTDYKINLVLLEGENE